MTSTAPSGTSVTTQIYRVFIKATPQAIWDAITTPEWTQRFGYGLRDVYELRPGGSYRGYANAGMTAMGMPEVVDGRRGHRGGSAAEAGGHLAHGDGPQHGRRRPYAPNV